MENWGVVEGVSHPYVAKGHLVSGQVKEKEGEKAVWVGQVRICVSEGEPGFWRVVVVVTTTEARAPAGQEEWV